MNGQARDCNCVFHDNAPSFVWPNGRNLQNAEADSSYCDMHHVSARRHKVLINVELVDRYSCIFVSYDIPH
jgi:hypothetical protein